MDPITAINMEFTQRVRADWARAAADERSEHMLPAPRRRAIERLRACAGAAWVVFDGSVQGTGTARWSSDRPPHWLANSRGRTRATYARGQRIAALLRSAAVY